MTLSVTHLARGLPAEPRADRLDDRACSPSGTRSRMALSEKRGFKEEDFAALHPGGSSAGDS